MEDAEQQQQPPSHLTQFGVPESAACPPQVYVAVAEREGKTFCFSKGEILSVESLNVSVGQVLEAHGGTLVPCADPLNSRQALFSLSCFYVDSTPLAHPLCVLLEILVPRQWPADTSLVMFQVHLFQLFDSKIIQVCERYPSHWPSAQPGTVYYCSRDASSSTRWRPHSGDAPLLLPALSLGPNELSPYYKAPLATDVPSAACSARFSLAVRLSRPSRIPQQQPGAMTVALAGTGKELCVHFFDARLPGQIQQQEGSCVVLENLVLGPKTQFGGLLHVVVFFDSRSSLRTAHDEPQQQVRVCSADQLVTNHAASGVFFVSPACAVTQVMVYTACELLCWQDLCKQSNAKMAALLTDGRGQWRDFAVRLDDCVTVLVRAAHVPELLPFCSPSLLASSSEPRLVFEACEQVRQTVKALLADAKVECELRGLDEPGRFELVKMEFDF